MRPVMVAGGDHGGGWRHQLAGLHGATDGVRTIVSSRHFKPCKPEPELGEMVRTGEIDLSIIRL